MVDGEQTVEGQQAGFLFSLGRQHDFEKLGLIYNTVRKQRWDELMHAVFPTQRKKSFYGCFGFSKYDEFATRFALG